MFFRCLYLDENATLIFILRFLNLSTYPCQGTVRTVQTCFFLFQVPVVVGFEHKLPEFFLLLTFLITTPTIPPALGGYLWS